MKNYFLSILSLLLIITSCSITKNGAGKTNKNASTQELLIGKWQYADINDKENMDAAGIKMLESFFGEMSFSFSADNLFDAFIMGKEGSGNWELNDTEDKLILTTKEEEVLGITILELTDNKMIILFEKRSFVMKKSES